MIIINIVKRHRASELVMSCLLLVTVFSSVRRYQPHYTLLPDPICRERDREMLERETDGVGKNGFDLAFSEAVSIDRGLGQLAGAVFCSPLRNW
jgi:hypothetical protein